MKVQDISRNERREMKVQEMNGLKWIWSRIWQD
jgi:hypothetical protein